MCDINTKVYKCYIISETYNCSFLVNSTPTSTRITRNYDCTEIAEMISHFNSEHFMMIIKQSVYDHIKVHFPMHHYDP
ncbi:hypothetical protein J437_LFUL001807 [Ladona fulva]|uniref:Uncharacterized protein n=1 Tax=Ladona fulva TaxID=123851 RepID=A0A8K0K196_LADFU|nr:hypothetical protein J437_LFUL001807 [Ladona fulva]